ncbi:hypothetical protein KNP414_07023 [Paenibacillus mucilaginosus KNP414]|uniref:Uncharacterized protein n=1 Tax=Paenibacillus mucilaginosus (strain KNP414) TaxID=1036673 RepID=F8FKE2_PAEMK|nr:hypothetical protein KNP414_07023 [Paenibacillus mucilaginosus KNP414]
MDSRQWRASARISESRSWFRRMSNLSRFRQITLLSADAGNKQPAF